jgi:hypothetical protein
VRVRRAVRRARSAIVSADRRAIAVVLLVASLGTQLVAIPAWAGISIALLLGALTATWIWKDRRADRDAPSIATRDGFSDGDSVEVDCRQCGQFNRVPASRLRDRPICGRCKRHLMPGRRVVICRTSRIEGRLSTELDALWDDEELLWRHLADHVGPRRADRRGVVN